MSYRSLPSNPLYPDRTVMENPYQSPSDSGPTGSQREPVSVGRVLGIIFLSFLLVIFVPVFLFSACTTAVTVMIAAQDGWSNVGDAPALLVFWIATPCVLGLIALIIYGIVKLSVRRNANR